MALSGIYRFHTSAQLATEKDRYVAEVNKAGSQLAGASINGQSYSFVVMGREMTLEEWGNELAAAFAQRGNTVYGEATSNKRANAF
jgi:hypothetical protein